VSNDDENSAVFSSRQNGCSDDAALQPLLSTLSAVELLHDSVLYKCTIDIDIDNDSSLRL